MAGTYNLPLGSIGISTPPDPGTYPNIKGQVTESGHIFMLDDTPDNEQILLKHAKSNTTIWMQPDGSTQTIVDGNNFTVIVNNNNVVIEGVCNIQVYADAKLEVRGSVFAQVNEDLIASVKRNSNISVGGKLDVSSGGDINISAGNASDFNPLTSPNIYLRTANQVVVKGDLNVTGSITGGGSISATTNVTAGYKLFATGGIETMGGLNVGFTLPGPILPTGVTTSLVSVNAPTFNGAFGNIGFLSTIYARDIIGSLGMLRMTYNTHFHSTDVGPTSPPIRPDTGEGPAPTVPGFSAPLISA